MTSELDYIELGYYPALYLIWENEDDPLMWVCHLISRGQMGRRRPAA